MTPHPTPRRGLFLGLLAISMLAGESARSQNLTGSVNAYDHPAYAGIASHFSVSNAQADGSFIFEGNIIIFCSDLAARSLDEDISSYPFQLTEANSSITIGSIDDFDVWDRYSTPQDEELAKAQAHWFIDNYYESHFINPPGGEVHQRQYAFQNVLWEIMGDGGTAVGLNFNDGNIVRSKFSPSGSASAPGLWSEMTGMVDAINAANVTTSYEPTFQTLAAFDSRDGYQDYFVLAANPNLMSVPEPSSGALCLVAFGLLAGRRRRTSL